MSGQAQARQRNTLATAICKQVTAASIRNQYGQLFSIGPVFAIMVPVSRSSGVVEKTSFIHSHYEYSSFL